MYCPRREQLEEQLLVLAGLVLVGSMPGSPCRWPSSWLDLDAGGRASRTSRSTRSRRPCWRHRSCLDDADSRGVDVLEGGGDGDVARQVPPSSCPGASGHHPRRAGEGRLRLEHGACDTVDVGEGQLVPAKRVRGGILERRDEGVLDVAERAGYRPCRFGLPEEVRLPDRRRPGRSGGRSPAKGRQMLRPSNLPPMNCTAEVVSSLPLP